MQRAASSLPLIRSEAGVCAGQHVFQLGAEFVQFNGKPGEPIVQLVVCGHGAWKQHKQQQLGKFLIKTFYL